MNTQLWLLSLYGWVQKNSIQKPTSDVLDQEREPARYSQIYRLPHNPLLIQLSGMCSFKGALEYSESWLQNYGSQDTLLFYRKNPLHSGNGAIVWLPSIRKEVYSLWFFFGNLPSNFVVVAPGYIN